MGLGLQNTAAGIDAVTPGNITGTYTLDCSGKPDIELSASLTGNVTITIANMPVPGRARLVLVQDTPGNRTVTLSDGTNTVTPTLSPTSPGTVHELEVFKSYPQDMFWKAR